MTFSLLKMIGALLMICFLFACSPLDKSEPPSISLFTLNGQTSNTVLVLPDTLTVEALLKDERGMREMMVSISYLTDLDFPTNPPPFSIDSSYIVTGTSSFVSKLLPLEADSTLGGLYQVSFQVVDIDGNRSAEVTKGFQVINSKPELLLLNIPDTVSATGLLAINYQVRHSSEALSSVSMTITGKTVNALGTNYDGQPTFQAEFSSFEGRFFTYNEVLNVTLNPIKVYELSITASDSEEQQSFYTKDIVVVE